MDMGQSTSLMHEFRMLPEGTRVEIIDNKLYFMPSPQAAHQKTLGKLYRRIGEFADEAMAGEVYFAPFDVYLDESFNAVQPDIVFVSHASTARLSEDGLHGAPDLVIEVLSPGNALYDQVKKKELYERFGVREYWMVDPITGYAHGYFLENGEYTPLDARQNTIFSLVLGTELLF